MQHIPVHSPLLESAMSVPFGPKWGGGGNPLSGGPATPSQPLNFNVATFNARRLWLSDHSVHDGFHMLVNLLTDENVEVLCVQEVFAGDFPSLPPNQPFTYDGPTSSRGREAGFLLRSGVSGFAIPGIEDALSLRWRAVDNSVCICSFYAHHAGLPEGVRVAF